MTYVDINDIKDVPVDVYRNLHKNTWSILNRRTGRVIARTDNVVVKNVKFVVQPAGRQRVIDEGRKNVPAFVRGTISTTPPDMMVTNVQVKYNPYILEPDPRAGHFYEVDTEETIGENEWVVLKTTGAWILKDRSEGLSEGLEREVNV